jgi:D-glycero-alpha-D-manno-heptose-7-phosphate kinase
MIISRTPFRISFLGGGTDYPDWYMKHGGSVLGTTIDKYCYLTCRYLPPFMEYRYRIVYSKLENCQTSDEIKHPAVRGVLSYLNINRGVEVHNDSDLPARSGMGSSSAFTVGFLNAVHALKGEMVSNQKLASESIEIEQKILKECVGSQDQVFAAYGGFNHIVFSKEGDISVRPLTVERERLIELNKHLMLFYTGIKRTAHNIAQSYVTDIEKRKRQLRVMRDLVDEGISTVCGNSDITAFGELLDEAWQIKRGLSKKVSNSDVDQIFATAKSAGAVGGKITGAGGGGFALFFVSPSNRQKVKEALKNLIFVPFKFEYNGSRIIFYDEENDYSEEDFHRNSQELNEFRELPGQSHDCGENWTSQL